MENNNYNNYNNNLNGISENNTNGAGTTGNSDYTGGQQESSSTYGYSYVGQEQKNPNNVWRAEDNTANGSAGSRYYNNNGGSNAQTDTNGSYYNNNSYSSAQADTNGSYYNNNSYSNAQTDTNGSYYNNNGYSNAQADANGSAYENIYGGGPNTQSRWSTYSEAKKQKKEARARKRAQRAASVNPGFGIKLAKCASIALVFGLVSGTAFEGSSYLLGNALGTNQNEEVVSTAKDVLSTSDDSKKKAVTTSAVPSTDVAAIAEECMPSIVAITNLSQVQYQNFFGQVQNYEIPSAGSGIIISEDNDYLYIATNNHVVESATTLTIQFVDSSTAAAEVKGTDESMDLAVVKVKKADIEAETLSAIKIAVLGDSDEVKVGSQAIAIGNALGYGQSVTTGVVSALEREVTIQDEKTGESFTNNLMQTDAAINPGNSGGALLNSDGEVIGINSSKYSDTDVEGMGFAIPSNLAKPIIQDLITRTVVSEDKAAYLGIVGGNVTSTVAESYNMPEGVFIKEISKGAAAEKYGLKQGDIITAFDGKQVKNMASLQSMLTYYEAGSEVEITIQRVGEDGGYKEQVVKVVLGKKNS